MSRPFFVRPYQPEDATQLQHLYAECSEPYRSEDAGEVHAMQRRALQAQATGDHWSPLGTGAPDVGEAAHLAFWVAVAPTSSGNETIGTVGLRQVGDPDTAGSDTAEHSWLASAQTWTHIGEVGEVRRLRVAPEWRRHGVATALMQELIAWSTASLQIRGLVLNTTAAQIPALALYRRFGFQELERSYLGSYELVWMQLSFSGVPVLTDGTVRLDGFQADDAERHLAGEDDEHARRFGWFPRHSTLPGVVDCIGRWQNEWATNGPIRAFALRLAASGELVGGCELRLRGDGSANMSYWTFPPHRRQGLATRAVRLAAGYAFATLGLTEIELQIAPDNAASLGVARRGGFAEVGTVETSPGADAEPRTMLRHLLRRTRAPAN